MARAVLVDVKGRVTGVGFRYSVYAEAVERKRITGYVRNLGCGHVEVLLQGEDAELNALLSFIRRGPPLARVTEVIVKEVPVDEFITTFNIR